VVVTPNVKVLVVEHEEQTRQRIDEILTALEFPYEVANSLSEARRCLVRDGYGLVLAAADIPLRPGARPRIQNAEHLMLSLRKAKGAKLPKVILLTTERPGVRDEDKYRWAAQMRSLGVSDFVEKPLADEGRTPDRVIRKVVGPLDANAADPSGVRHPAPPGGAVADGADGWLTVTQAAELLMHDVPGLDLAKARARTSTAASRQEFSVAGTRKGRRIDPVSFAAWRLQQRDRDLDNEDAV
jgi:CheY-like chemotaxis protein